MTRVAEIKRIVVQMKTAVRGGAILANHKSAMKRNRQNKIRNARNTIRRTQVKTAAKKTLAAIADKDQTTAQQTLKLAEKAISKLSSSGAIHRRAASRKVSQLAKRVNQMASGT